MGTRLLRPLAPALLLAASFLAGGCGKGDGAGKNSVSGKVTVNGQPVAGEVVFIGPDNRENRTPITLDGSYTVSNPAAGENRILVRGFGGVDANLARRADRMPKDISKTTGTPKLPGAAPPAKYAQPNNGLTFHVTGGRQKHDIELTP